ncbi:hypothetical protein [Cognataquiflexum aquatile]|uniref:hypothetical protein n=1 Tax=Cognataquiflexum aquatile TaxID=2249427 RepID=UPI000DE90DF1|nr:hypothetical protein [Cognataquiflexum aquatile]
MKNSIVFSLILIVLSCSAKNRKSIGDIFNPDFQLTYKDIEGNGFKFPYGEVDVPMLVKQYGDTTVAYQFDDSVFSVKSKPVYMWIEFPIDGASVGDYFWYRNNCVIVCQSKNDSGRDVFTVRNTRNNYFYGASIWESEEDTTNFKLLIDFHFPKFESR